MTAALRTPPSSAPFERAPQTTFAPRPLALVAAPAPAAAPRLVAPVGDAAAEAPLATVHRLPVYRTAGVYRRRRLVALALLVGVVLGIASFVRHADATPTPEGQLAESVTVVVQPGDSLWAIAETLAPGGNTRALVAELEAIAGGAVLQPGQQLVVPGHLLG